MPETTHAAETPMNFHLDELALDVAIVISALRIDSGWITGQLEIEHIAP